MRLEVVLVGRLVRGVVVSALALSFVKPALVSVVDEKLSTIWAADKAAIVVSGLADILVITLPDAVSHVGTVLVHGVSRYDTATKLGRQLGTAFLEVMLDWVIIPTRDEVKHRRVLSPWL